MPGTASELEHMRMIRDVDFDTTTPEKPPKSQGVILRGDSQAETLILGEGSQQGTPKYVPSSSGKKPSKDKPVTLAKCRRLPSRMTAAKSKAKKQKTRKSAEKTKTGASKDTRKQAKEPGMEPVDKAESSKSSNKPSVQPDMNQKDAKGSNKKGMEPKETEQGSTKEKEKKDDSQGCASKQPEQPGRPPLQTAPSTESLTPSVLLNRAPTSVHPDTEETQDMDMDIDPDVLDALVPEPTADAEKPKKKRDLKAHARRQKFYRSLVSPSLSLPVYVGTLRYVNYKYTQKFYIGD